MQRVLLLDTSNHSSFNNTNFNVPDEGTDAFNNMCSGASVLEANAIISVDYVLRFRSIGSTLEYNSRAERC